MPAYSSGYQSKFERMSLSARRFITLLIWTIASGILVLYSYIIYWWFPNQRRAGFITMIAVLATDIILYFIYNSKIVRSATPLAVTLFLNRLFIIVFGNENWIYGFILLYIFYGCILSVIIAKKTFPF